MGNGKLLICSLPMAGTDSLFSASWIIFRFCSSIFLLNVRVPPPGIDMTFVHTKSLSRPFSRGAAKRPLEKALTVGFSRSPTCPLVHYWPGLTLDNLRAFDAIGSAPHFLPPAGLLCFVLLQNLATLCNLTCNLATPLYYWVPATHLQQPSVQFLLSNLSSLLIAAHSQTVSHILSPFLVENVSWGWTNQQSLIRKP